MWISPHVRPLLTTDNPNSSHVVAWIGPLAGSKVVAIQLGHGPTAFGNPSYRALVHNAILWAAGRTRSDSAVVYRWSHLHGLARPRTDRFGTHQKGIA